MNPDYFKCISGMGHLLVLLKCIAQRVIWKELISFEPPSHLQIISYF